MGKGRARLGPIGRKLQESAEGSLTVGYQTAIMEAMACIDEIMDERGISRKELAEMLNVDPSRVSKLLNDPDNITVRTFYRLCNAVGLKPSIRADRGPRLVDSNDWKAVPDGGDSDGGEGGLAA